MCWHCFEKMPPSENKSIYTHVTRNDYLSNNCKVHITLYCLLSSNSDRVNYTNSILISNYVKLK